MEKPISEFQQALNKNVEELGIQHVMGKLTKLEKTIARLEALVCELVNRDGVEGKIDDKEIKLYHFHRKIHVLQAEHNLRSKKKSTPKEPSLFDEALPF